MKRPVHRDRDAFSARQGTADDKSGGIWTRSRKPVSIGCNRGNGQAGSAFRVERRIRPETEDEPASSDRRPEGNSQSSVRCHEAGLDSDVQDVARWVPRRRGQRGSHSARRRRRNRDGSGRSEAGNYSERAPQSHADTAHPPRLRRSRPTIKAHQSTADALRLRERPIAEYRLRTGGKACPEPCPRIANFNLT